LALVIGFIKARPRNPATAHAAKPGPTAVRNESAEVGLNPCSCACSDEIGEARMFLMGLGALLVLGGVLYMARATIWRGSLSRPARDTLEPPRRGVGFLGLNANWPGILLMAIGAILLVSGASF
jgi:hypothetical protein